MSDSIGLKLLGKDQAFQFFSYLFNLEEWASDVRLRSDAGVDRQLVHAPVEWHSDHLRIGRRYVQMFPLINTPEISRPCLFTNLMELDCDSILCSVWRPRPDHATRKEVSNQEKFLEFFKLSPFQRLMSGRNTAPLENTATAKAVAGNVDNLSEVVSSLDKLSQGDYALRLLLAADTAAELRAATPSRPSSVCGCTRPDHRRDLRQSLRVLRHVSGQPAVQCLSAVAARRPSCAALQHLRATSRSSSFGRPRRRVPEYLRDPDQAPLIFRMRMSTVSEYSSSSAPPGPAKAYTQTRC